jgi:pimeloyl-ACP methyl ester carboxylesterase
MSAIMRRFSPVLLCMALVLRLAAQTPSVPSPFQRVQESISQGVVEAKGQVVLLAAGAPVAKRFVLRYPAGTPWNGGLVIGAHGGSGGNNFDPTGKVIGTDETALDDVIGRHAVAGGFAYASVDRDGAVNARDGLRLTNQFADLVAANIATRLGRPPARRYLVGLSMGGGITRAAAEDPAKRYAGTLIVAGAGGDLAVRTERQQKLAALWPAIDPRTHPGLPDDDPQVQAFAKVIGTPAAARRLWPYTATNAVNAASRPAQRPDESSTGRVWVPTVEVVGTWDDFVHAELLAYDKRVQPASLHRLYQVDGVWHMSGDDDGVQSFMFIATKMGLDSDVAQAMGEGPSYLPIVRQAFDALVRWVETNQPAPASQTVRPGERLR